MVCVCVQMHSVSGDAFGSWSEAVSFLIDFPTVIDDPGSNVPLVLGLSIPIAIIVAILLALIVFLIIYIAYRQFKMRHSLKVHWNH